MSAGFKGRREDRRLITGKGCFTTDWKLPGELHAVFLRADRAHAEIRSMDITPALAVAGVVAVFTGEDAERAGIKTPPSFVTFPGKGGQMIKTPARPVLATRRVRFVGENVAMVVATSALAAQDGVEAIAIDYADLPSVVDVDDAVAAGAPQLYPEIPGNVCFEYEYGDEARTDEAFSRAAHVTKLSLDSQRVVGNPMEPRSCIASYDREKDVYDVYSSTQGMGMMRGGLSAFTGIPPQKIRVHALDVGGGFGIRSGPYPEYPVLMLAAKQLGKTVRWTGTRSETISSDYHGRAIRLAGELALDGDGKFLGIRIRWTCNQGAYLSGAGPLINTANPALTSCGTYSIPAVHGVHRLGLTNTTPITAYRGAGRPDMAYIIERMVDQAALETGVDRLELRRRNFIPKEAFPFQTQVDAVYDSGDFRALLDESVVQAGWKDFETRRAEAKKRGKLRGIGCGVFIEPAGSGLLPKDQVSIKFGSSGEIKVYSLSGPSGQGHETVFADIVAEALGLASEVIEVRAGDPDGPQDFAATGTIGSRSMMHHGSAMLNGANEAIRKGMDLAARDLEVALADLEYKNGEYRVKGTDRAVKLLDLARKYAAKGATPLDTIGEMAMHRAFPSGAHVAEVEIDPDTGVVDVLSYIGVDDCGRIINHTLLEGQMHGGILQGAGQVFGEHCVYDRATGQLMTGSFMDYYMPRAGLVPTIELYDHPVPSPNNPLGVKGAGEAGTTGALPTLMNAILDALRPAGVGHLDMPATPSRVWNILQDARQAARAN